MKDIAITLEPQGLNYLPGCGGSLNLVSLCGCTVDALCPAS